MNKMYKTITSVLIIILLMLATTGIVGSQIIPIAAREQINENIGNVAVSTSDVPVAEIEEAKLATIAEEKARFENRKNAAPKYTKSTKKGNVETQVTAVIPTPPIPKVIPVDIAYTNPITGISQFATYFNTGNIYDTNFGTWNSYNFYLPVAAYVDMKFNGRIGSISDATYYNMYVDDDFLNDAYDNSCWWETGADVCYIPIQTSRLTYLSKGWHTLYISGWGGLESGWSYSVQGYPSIIAFPEYTAITVIVPNGYETWYRGQTKTITWKSDGSPGANVKIELFKAGVKNAVISSKTSNDGSYSWYIPTYQPIGTDYKIRITSYENPTYTDISNNNFKIY